MRLIVLFPLACLLAGTGCTTMTSAPRTTPAVFYLDSQHGDDTANGQAPAHAWRSLDRLNREPLIPGDHVQFRRGGLWRGTLRPCSGSAEARILYGAYGEGPKPILCGSVAANDPEQWQTAGPGLWATRPLEFATVDYLRDLATSTWGVHQENGAVVSLTEIAAQGNQPRMYRLDCQAAGTAGNHIQLWGPAIPTHADEYLELQFRARSSLPCQTGGIAVMLNRPPWTATASSSQTATIGDAWQTVAIRFRAARDSEEGRLHIYLGGTVPAGTSLLFQPLGLRRVRCTGGMALTVDVGNIIFDGGPVCGTKKWRTEDLQREGDYAYLGDTAQVMLRADRNPAERWQSIELALRRHIVDEGGIHHVTYENLDLRYGAAHGFGGGNTAFLTIRDCDLSYIGGGHQFTNRNGHPVRFGNAIEFWNGGHDHLVEGCRIWEVYDAALTNQGNGDDSLQINLTYRNNVIWNSEYSFEYWNRPATARTAHILFEHNTCVDAGHGWGHAQRPDPNGGHLMFYQNSAATEDFVVRDNLFVNSTEVCLRMDNDWRHALTFDHNLWWNGDGAGRLIRYFVKTYYTAQDFAAFQQESNLAGNALVAEPVFRDPQQRDYRLAPDSPGTTAAHDGGPVGALPQP